MIAKKYRFHGHNSLRRVLASGSMSRSKFFTVKWTTNERRHHPRLSGVVSKKVFKSAVKRNRVRRRIYEIARPLLNDALAVDIVVIVHATDALEASHDELTIQLLPLLHETGLKPKR